MPNKEEQKTKSAPPSNAPSKKGIQSLLSAEVAPSEKAYLKPGYKRQRRIEDWLPD
jgi:hypothetical protein